LRQKQKNRLGQDLVADERSDERSQNSIDFTKSEHTFLRKVLTRSSGGGGVGTCWQGDARRARKGGAKRGGLAHHNTLN